MYQTRGMNIILKLLDKYKKFWNKIREMSINKYWKMIITSSVTLYIMIFGQKLYKYCSTVKTNCSL